MKEIHFTLRANHLLQTQMNNNKLLKVVSNKSLPGCLKAQSKQHDKICCAAEVSKNKAKTFIKNSDHVQNSIVEGNDYCFVAKFSGNTQIHFVVKMQNFLMFHQVVRTLTTLLKSYTRH